MFMLHVLCFMFMLHVMPLGWVHFREYYSLSTPLYPYSTVLYTSLHLSTQTTTCWSESWYSTVLLNGYELLWTGLGVSTVQ